jgi:hypothetical protein
LIPARKNIWRIQAAAARGGEAGVSPHASLEQKSTGTRKSAKAATLIYKKRLDIESHNGYYVN